MPDIKGATNEIHHPSSGLQLSFEAFELGDIDRVVRVDKSRSAATVDLSSVTWIDLPVLLRIVALARQVIKDKLSYKLLLPSSDRVLLWLDSVSFFDAHSLATNRPIERFLTPADQTRLTEIQETTNPYIPKALGTNIDLLSHYYFAIKSYTSLRDRDADLPYRLAKEWDNFQVNEVLANSLGDENRQVASEIIFEMATNAIEHGANIYQMCAQREPAHVRNRAFWISMWDDGRSVAATFGDQVRSGKTYSVPVVEAEQFDYLVQDFTEDGDDRFSTTPFHPATFKPDAGSTKELLLGAVLPGFSRKAADYLEVQELLTGKQGVDHKFTTEFLPPGMGLFNLCRIVCHGPRGQVYLRTDDLLLRIRASRSQPFTRFVAEMWRSRNAVPNVLGNLISVRMPLDNSARAEVKAPRHEHQVTGAAVRAKPARSPRKWIH